MNYQIYLFNSLTRKIEKFTPLEDKIVRMYSCGPTVYNFAHIGNMRSFLFADLLQRTLRVVGGYKVRWVMNITNIDDKTIRDSSIGSPAWLPEMGKQTDDPLKNLLKFTEYYRKAFIEDIQKLGINLKDFYKMPKATDYIPQMQELVRRIVEKGFGYIVNGSVYFDVSKWRQYDIYGKLYHIDFEKFREGSRIDSDSYDKDEFSDFALWKAKKEGEPFWEFTLNGIKCDGRPGWHLECSVMEREILGLPFDIHTGGVDLKFPHHEDEIAQSKAGYGVEPTVFWCHNEFLLVEGKKMSKSLGNFYTLRDLLEKGIDPIDIRYLMLSAHYSTQLNFTFDGLNSARKARMRVQNYIYELFDNKNATGKQIDIQKLNDSVFGELANDLQTPRALANLFEFINENPANEISMEYAKDLLQFFDNLNKILNVWKIEPRPQIEVQIPDEVKEMAEKRFQARKSKNFALADQLRDEIKAKGFQIVDTKDGYIIEPLEK
ncbi:cysteine--tRNA ligase [Bacteroidetes/Chlorobi group bacterium Naka2016]|nr:MAG: cysteine--tRNA ligase [Bacteroidetes/Chlorobi group bacterium Naka2016]